MNIRSIKLIIFSVFFFSNSSGQGINNFWLSGDTGYINKLNFYSGSLVITGEPRQMPFYATYASISDTSGNLLFYTNGNYIANALDDTMMNGSGLNPSQCVTDYASGGLQMEQADLIIPDPGTDKKYYLFHEGCDYSNPNFCPSKLYYSIIDMTLDSGKGSVILKNNIILNITPLDFGQITAAKHANGRDWWIVAHALADTFFTFLLTPYGLHGPFVQHYGFTTLGGQGQVVFSPDGNKYVHYGVFSNLDIFDFDRCTGQFSNWQHIDFPNNGYWGGGLLYPLILNIYMLMIRIQFGNLILIQ